MADQVKYANESQPKSTHKKAHTKAVLHKKKKVVNKSLNDTSDKIIKVARFFRRVVPLLHIVYKDVRTDTSDFSKGLID